MIWFRAFPYFRTWSKTYAKRWANNSLLPGDKTISFLLELIYHVLSISEYVLEKLVAFDFDEKFIQSSVAQITMLYHVLEDFLHLHCAADQFKDMTWKWKTAV